MQLDRVTYPDKDVIRAMGQVVPLKQNTDTVGKKAALKYNVQSLPNLLILDERGKVVATSIGFKDPKSMVAWINDGVKAYKAAHHVAHQIKRRLG